MEQRLQPQAPTQPKQTQHPPKQHHPNLPNIITKPNNNNNNNNNNNSNSIDNTKVIINNKKAIWDCGSTLYDSFELNSFQKQLDSAIINSSRTLSMPRLPSQYHREPPPPPTPSKKSKLSRSFQKLLKSVFRAPKLNTKPNYDSSSPDPWYLDQEQDKNMKVVDSGRYFVVIEKPNGLSTIPETPEVGLSPEIRSLVRKTMSDRFSFTPPATSDGIYCV